MLLAISSDLTAFEAPDDQEEFMANTSSLTGSCGVERWSVKTGTDADAGLINLTAYQPASIVTMAAWTKPSTLPANNRILPYETTVWVINATLTVYVLEADSDIHLVLDDGAGHTLIAEIPDPACVGPGSPLLNGVLNARQEFLALYTPTGTFKTANVPVQIVGVGFFDFLHGQTGVAPNGIELHSVLDIIFNPSPAPDFTLGITPSSATINQGSSANFSVTTQALSTFNTAISFSAIGSPAGAVVSFSPVIISAPGSGSSTLSVATDCATTPGTYPMTVTASGASVIHTFEPSVTVLADSSVPDVGNTLQLDSIGGCSGATHPVISQIQMAGAAGGTDEFVELYNPTNTPFDLTGYAIKYRSATHVSGTTLVNFSAGTVIPDNGYLLVATANYSGATTPDVLSVSGMSPAAGHLYLLQRATVLSTACPLAGTNIIDLVGYGAAAACPEGGLVAFAPAPAANQSIKRLPNNSSGSGTDTDNNAADFLASSTSTPRNSSTVVNCGGIILRWAAAPVDNYHIYRSDEPTMLNGAQVADLPQGITQFSDATAGSWFYLVFNYTVCGGESGD